MKGGVPGPIMEMWEFPKGKKSSYLKVKSVRISYILFEPQ